MQELMGGILYSNFDFPTQTILVVDNLQKKKYSIRPELNSIKCP